MTAYTEETKIKLERLRRFMDEHGYAAIRLQTPNLFAWLTGGGRNHIDITSTWTGAALYVTRSNVVCVMADNELDRIRDEELAGVLDCEIRRYPWWGWAQDAVKDLYENGTVAGDVPFPGVVPIAEELRSLFYPLTAPEIERYRALAAEVSDIMTNTLSEVREGMTELDVDGMLSAAFRRRGIHPNVLMVAADGRAERYKHPLPTMAKLRRYAVVSVCASRGGLVVSQTRSVHLGEPDTELREQHRAASYIAARLIAGTREGVPLEELYRTALAAYKEVGWPEEWVRHTIGGKTGYRTREFSLGPASAGVVERHTAWGWNPTVGGTKSEDTVIAGPDAPEVLGEDARWPHISFELEGKVWKRPAILVIT